MLAMPPSFTYRARLLRPGDLGALQALCASNLDYYTLVHGRAAPPDEAEHLLLDAPPGVPREAKRVIGFHGPGGKLEGVLDLVEGFRRPGEWYLGLLLLSAEARSRGHGAAILDALGAWLLGRGAARIRLACAEQNVAALRFWRRHGFVEDRRFPARDLGARQTVLIELVKALRRDAPAAPDPGVA